VSPFIWECLLNWFSTSHSRIFDQPQHESSCKEWQTLTVIKGKARDVKHLSRSLFLAVWYEFEQRDGKSFLLTCVSALARLRERTGLSHKRVWPCRVYVSLSVKHDSCFQTDLREMKKQEKGERELRSLLNPSRSSRWSPHYMLKNTNHKHVVFLSVFYYAIPHIIHLKYHHKNKYLECFSPLQTWYMGWWYSVHDKEKEKSSYNTSHKI